MTGHKKYIQFSGNMVQSPTDYEKTGCGKDKPKNSIIWMERGCVKQ